MSEKSSAESKGEESDVKPDGIQERLRGHTLIDAVHALQIPRRSIHRHRRKAQCSAAAQRLVVLGIGPPGQQKGHHRHRLIKHTQCRD